MAVLQALHDLRVNVNPDTLTNVESTGAKVALLTKKGEVVTVKSTTLSISHGLQVRLQVTKIHVGELLVLEERGGNGDRGILY